MNTSLLHRTVIVSVILLGGSFHSDSALAEGCPAPSFAAARTFDAGKGAWSLAVGDFNGDGKPDLAVANHACSNCSSAFSGSFSVLLGNGDGTFQSAVNYDAGTDPVSVAVGDFNGDGKPDLAVVNSGSTNVALLLGKGDGTFQSAVNYDTSTGTNPNSVAIRDFNGDSKPDLAVANYDPSSKKVSVLLGNGNGTFQSAVNFSLAAEPYSVAASDFNGDGNEDLAIATHVGITLLLGKGDGTFQAAVNYGAGTHPNFVAVGGFHTGGTPDVGINRFSFGRVFG